MASIDINKIRERTKTQSVKEASLSKNKPLTFPCAYRGLATGERKPCESGCGKGKMVPLQTCSLHGKCSVSLPLKDVPCCRTCPDRKEGPHEPMSPLGITKGPLLIVPEPPRLELVPTKKRALVTVAFGESGKLLLASTEKHMRAYAQEHDADFVILDWPGHPDWAISSKFAIPRTLEFYERIAYVDADVLLRPGCISLFDSCAPDEFGFCDELAFHRSQPQHKREWDFLKFRKQMGFKDIPNLPFMINAGIMVVPREYASYLMPPKTPMLSGHCSEQDHTCSKLIDNFLEGKCKIRMLDRRCNWQNWTDWEFKSAPRDAILHWSGGGKERKHRHEVIKEWADKYPVPEVVA